MNYPTTYSIKSSLNYLVQTREIPGPKITPNVLITLTCTQKLLNHF